MRIFWLRFSWLRAGAKISAGLDIDFSNGWKRVFV